MADTTMSAPATGRPLPNVAVEHRLNHIDFGHLGRVAYSPVDDDEQPIGRLQTSRSVDSHGHFKLLSPLTEVLPPTRTALPEAVPGEKPSDTARAQKKWLLENHPEAVAGGEVDAHTLADELRTLKSAAAQESVEASSSLLAVGEITDRTSGTVGRPAIAMAAGEGGHILRVIPLNQEDAAWPDKNLSVRMNKVSPSAVGIWDADGVPITTIKFAVDGRRFDPIRWFLVQRPTGTSLLEPDINVMPYQGGISEYERSHLFSQLPRNISVNPIFTIEARKTGGAAHVDVCFNPVADGRSPQLAIIDAVGRWSVWDITGSRSVTPKILQPMLTARGSIDAGPAPGLQTILENDPATHKLLYVLPSGKHRVKQENDQDSSDHQHWGLYSRSPVRSNHLLVCSDTDVRLYDAAQGVQLAGIRVVNANRAETIVDMQGCPICPSQALVLTTSSLYWLDTMITGDGHFRISVISSFPHYKKADAGALTLSVSPLARSASPEYCAALVVSAQDKPTDMFVFTKPSAEEVAHSVHRLISADLPSSTRSVFISPLLAGRNKRAKGEAVNHDAAVPEPRNCRVFQLFGLQSDLSLGTALFAMSDMPLHDLDAPHSSHGAKKSDRLRKKYLRHVENTFVVPDGYEERAALSQSDTESQHYGTDPDRKPAKKKQDVINLETAYERLEELVAGEISPAKMPRQLLAGVIHRRGMEELGDNDHMRVRTLSELVGNKLNACDLDTLEEEWTTFREEIDSAYEGKVQVAELDGGSFPRDLQSLTWQLSTLSYVNEDAPDAYKEKQRQILRHLAGKQYLSLFGISVVSPSTIASTGAEALASQRAAQTADDESLPPSSPPSLGGSHPRHSQDLMDIDEQHPTRNQASDQVGPLARLRKYVDIPTTPATAALSGPPRSRLLSHWPHPGGETASDPWSFVWEEDEGPLTAEDEEAMQRRRRRDEARRRRSAKQQRLSVMGLLPVEEDDAGGPSTTTQVGYAVPTPRAALSSQPRGEGRGTGGPGPSQSQRPRISMSQVVPGPHGGRMGAAKKKKKGGFR